MSKPDDPFDDDWGMPEAAHGSTESSSEMPNETREERPPFLMPHRLPLSVSAGTLELIRVTSETSEYSDVVLLVSYSGKNYRLGMKLFADDYKQLLATYGKKREDWHGTLRFKVLPHKGKERGFISVRPMRAEKKK